MAEEQVPGPSEGPSGDGPWLTVAAAARQMGISPRAIRGRIRRGTIEWKAQGNAGKLVRVPSGDASPDNPGDGPRDELAELLAELAEVRELLARAAAERDAAESVAEAQVEAARTAAAARVDAAEARAAAVRELADRLTAELADARRARVDAAKAEAVALRELADRLTAELAEVRRPWWRLWRSS